MTTIRTHAWRIILVVSGLLIIAGGRMHPSAEAGGSLREELAEMTADPSWIPGHTLVMLGTLGIVIALWWARSLGVWSRTGRALTVAAVAMSLYAVETVFHLAAAVDADNLAHGHAAPVAFTHIGLSIVLYPLAGTALAWLGVSLNRTESGVRRVVPVLAVLAGTLHAISVPATILLPDAEISPVFALAGVGMALWALLTGVVGATDRPAVELTSEPQLQTV